MIVGSLGRFSWRCILLVYFLILALTRAIAAGSPDTAANGSSESPPDEWLPGLLTNRAEANLSQLLQDRFKYLFSELANETSSTGNDELKQSNLETRKIDGTSAQTSATGYLQNISPNIPMMQQVEQELINKDYFKILNRVFSRIELPEVFKSPKLKGASGGLSSSGSYCGQHIGCLEAIPNFPSLLKKVTNVSSSFTIYTRDSLKWGHKVQYEPLIHHQLEDGSGVAPVVTTAIVESSGGKRRTASSWRTANRVVRSQEYPFDLAAMEQSGFNSSRNTRVIIGGYFAKEDEEWIDEVVKQWLLLEPDSNVIKVSWADANRGLYHSAAYNSRIVARQVSLFLHYLDQLFKLDMNKFHLVGHSLGAHIAGFVGADHEGRLARITGLDPAGPIFVELNTSLRLDPTDAKFVDVLHTNGGSITKGALGLSTPSGHVDYYCNGGSVQPGCYFSSVTRSIMDPVERVACNHRRSYRYFIELIKLAIAERQQQTTTTVPSRQQQQVQEEPTSFAGELGPATGYFEDAADLARTAQSDTGLSQKSHPLPSSSSNIPRAFLFEAKNEELVKLYQPEILLASSSHLLRRHMADLTEAPPLKRQLEFHLLNPDFPPGKRGMYFFRTRPEAPFFATKQYALTLTTETVVRRKIALMAKLDYNLIIETEMDEIPGICTVAFVPADPKLLNLADQSSPIPHLTLMWRYRSFNLLLNQQNELQISSIELSLLDSDLEMGNQPTIRYTPSSNKQAARRSAPSGSATGFTLTLANNSTGTPFNNGTTGGTALVRNQWHKFEGKLVKGK